MTTRDSASSEITPEVLLRAYACGIFPMAESADDPTLFWVEPEMRGVIPLDGFRISSRLARPGRLEGGAGAPGGAADHGRLRITRHAICDQALAQLWSGRGLAAALYRTARQGDQR